MIDVLLADDQALVRGGFRAILGTHPDLRVIAEAADGEEAVRRARAVRPDVCLLDVRMPRMDGIEATRRIVAVAPATKVLVLTTYDLDQYVVAAFRAGACGFLLKTVPPEALAAAVRTVHAGESLLDPSLTRRLVERFVTDRPRRDPRLSRLTEREREVLLLVARGRSNAEIAATLHVGVGTVKTHVGRILAKLELRDRVQAVVLAYESGLVVAGVTPGG